jgi:hypothetical protein
VGGRAEAGPDRACEKLSSGAVHVRIIQQPDKVLLIYTGPSTDVRRVRLNDRHPEPLTPSGTGIRSVITRAIRW